MDMSVIENSTSICVQKKYSKKVFQNCKSDVTAPHKHETRLLSPQTEHSVLLKGGFEVT